jgi:nucleotide-binding universal stress UspA family protein
MPIHATGPMPTDPSLHTGIVASGAEGSAPATIRRVLLATDGMEPSDAACRLAQVLADERGCQVEALTVYEPRHPLVDDLGISDESDGEATELFYRIYTQLCRTTRSASQWRIRLEVGRPADTIARVAREVGADLILVGLAHHRPLDRLLGNETALQVVRRSRVPLLAVAPALRALPRRALLCLDFGPASVRAARTALALLDAGATAHLAYVRTGMEVVGSGGDAETETLIARLLHAMRDGLGTPASVSVEPVVLSGDPARALLQCAERLAGADEGDLDLVVLGTHQRSPLERLAFGSVAAKLLRAGRGSMLVTPEPGGSADVAPARAAGAGTTLPAPRGPDATPAWQAVIPGNAAAIEWVRLMREFSERNASRLSMLEVDDLELGAQPAARGYELRGVTYDHRDGRVQIMLGDLERSERHLTHSVSGVTAVEVQRDAAGHDLALRVAHAAGQTLLTFGR